VQNRNPPLGRSFHRSGLNICVNFEQYHCVDCPAENQIHRRQILIYYRVTALGRNVIRRRFVSSVCVVVHLDIRVERVRSWRTKWPARHENLVFFL